MDVIRCSKFLPLISRSTIIIYRFPNIIHNIITNNHDDLNCSPNDVLAADIFDNLPIFHISMKRTSRSTGKQFCH